VQCRGENLDQLAVAAATSGRAGPTWTRATESIRFLARLTVVMKYIFNPHSLAFLFISVYLVNLLKR